MAGLCFAEFALEIITSLQKAGQAFPWIQEGHDGCRKASRQFYVTKKFLLQIFINNKPQCQGPEKAEKGDGLQ